MSGGWAEKGSHWLTGRSRGDLLRDRSGSSVLTGANAIPLGRCDPRVNEDIRMVGKESATISRVERWADLFNETSNNQRAGVKTSLNSPERDVLLKKGSVKAFKLKPNACFRCGNVGHYQRNCRDPIICYQCGRVGHRKRTCRASKQKMEEREVLGEGEGSASVGRWMVQHKKEWLVAGGGGSVIYSNMANEVARGGGQCSEAEHEEEVVRYCNR